MNLTFISGNQSKIIETTRLLRIPFESLILDLTEIQDISTNNIVEHKVREAYKSIMKPVFVDDVGLFIEAWNGFPGPFVKWIDKSGGMELLIKMMHKETNRNVIASTTIGYFDGVNFEIFLGEVKGTISKEIRGLNGFGWDTIFIPNGSDKTYAELKDEEKDTYSQRAIALKKFQIFLKGKM